MTDHSEKTQFHSPLAPHMEKFLQEKRVCGCRYASQVFLLRNLDRLLVEQGLSQVELPRTFVEQWTAKQLHERVTTQIPRLSLIRQFAGFLTRHGIPAFVPFVKVSSVVGFDFVPHIFSIVEIERLLNAADGMGPTKLSPFRHLVLPELFRLLYGCGLRIGEALGLTVADVDLEQGILTIRDAKGKDRLVPMTPSLTDRLRSYWKQLNERGSEAIFFPTAAACAYATGSVYSIFRELLRRAGIPHGGRGHGPRLHDIRHTFAVHRFARWYREGVDLNAKLPVLATYMGHESRSRCRKLRFASLLPIPS